MTPRKVFPLAFAFVLGHLAVTLQAAGSDPTEESRPVFTHGCAVGAIVFTPDGACIVSGADDGIIRVWDRKTGLEVRQMTGHKGRVSSLSFDRDGRTLASGSGDHTMCVWDFATGKLRHRCEGHDGWVRSVSISPDGKTVATGSLDGTCRLWDAATGKELRRLDGHQGPVMGVSFSADGELLATTDSLCAVRIWNVAAGKELSAVPKKRVSDDITGVAMCGGLGGRQLAATASSYYGIKLYRGISIWNGENAEAMNSFFIGSSTLALAASANGRLLMAGTKDGDILVCETLSRTALLTIHGTEGAWPGSKTKADHPASTSAIYSLAFSPDSAWIAAGTKDGHIRLWRLADLAAAGAKADKLRDGDLDDAWNDLASADPSTAYRALVRLTAAPAIAVPFLKKRLVPAPRIDETRSRRWLAQLDADDFATRERASDELQRCGDSIRALLSDALDAGKLSPEAANRVRRLLGRLASGEPPPEQVREFRAVQALEWLATPEAAGLLGTLAKGQRGIPLTVEAAQALRRLERRAKQSPAMP